MQVEYRLEESDLHDLQAQLLTLRRAKMAASVVPFLGAIAGAGAVGFPIWLLLHPGWPLLQALRPFLGVLAAAAVVVALLKPMLVSRRSPRLHAWTLRRLAQASARRSILGPVTVETGPDALVRRNEKNELRFHPSDILDVLASPRLLTVRPRGRGPVILLPARAFRDGVEFAAARAQLEALAGTPAVEIDPHRATVERAGPPPARRKVRPELSVALALALISAATHVAASRAYDPRRTNQPGHVVMYATAWCPACARLRTCLASSRVAYDERDIERSREAETQYRELGGGGVPLTLVGAAVVHGVDVPALGDALAAAGQSFDCPAR